jgi:hypothetical protein
MSGKLSVQVGEELECVGTRPVGATVHVINFFNPRDCYQEYSALAESISDWRHGKTIDDCCKHKLGVGIVVKSRGDRCTVRITQKEGAKPHD